MIYLQCDVGPRNSETLGGTQGFTPTTVTKDSSADILRALEGVACQRVLETEQISMMATEGCGELQLLHRLFDQRVAAGRTDAVAVILWLPDVKT